MTLVGHPLPTPPSAADLVRRRGRPKKQKTLEVVPSKPSRRRHSKASEPGEAWSTQQAQGDPWSGYRSLCDGAHEFSCGRRVPRAPGGDAMFSCGYGHNEDE